MPDLRQQNEAILAACKSGHTHALEIFFTELEIGPQHPKNPWDFDRYLGEDQHAPCVYAMVHSAIQGLQIDTLSFLVSAKFPNTSLCGRPIASAINTLNTNMVRAVCALDPAAANSDDGQANVLALACKSEAFAEIVKVLFAHGADPNKAPVHLFPYSNFYYAVVGGMPLETFRLFFDAGYHCNDPWGLSAAIKYKRQDVVELFFTQGKGPAWFRPQQELIGLAMENNDSEMAALIKRLYPSQKRGLVATLIKRLGV